MKKYIPNIFTFLNMFSGLVALTLVFKNQLEWTAYFVFLGIFFDFFDGFFARLFRVQNEIGVQLDSLADMITSGAVPGAVIFVLLSHIVNENLLFSVSKIYNYLPYFGFILTFAAAYRLAKFNVDVRQKDGFIGVPTPAMSLFVVSIPLIILYSKYPVIVNLVQSFEFLIATVLIFSFLMNSNLSIFALKFKSFDWKNNWIKYVFVLTSFLMIGIFKVVAIPLAVILYILLSILSVKRVESIK